MSTVQLTVPASVAAAGSALRDRRRRLVAPGLGDRVIVEFAAAGDVRSGMARVVAMLRGGGGAGRVEWWSPADNSSSLRLEVADGHGRGRRVAVPAGPAGVVVVVGGDTGPELSAAVRRLAPVLRRRWTEERLAQQAVQLARHNQALGDFAALVAHELKTPLELARRQHDPSVGVERALELVDLLLEAAWAESASQGRASAADCLDEAMRDLGPVASAGFWSLTFDDDGVGVAEAKGYVEGSRLGLSLCRRLAGRFGGALELAPRAVGGTRASVVVDRSRR